MKLAPLLRVPLFTLLTPPALLPSFAVTSGTLLVAFFVRLAAGFLIALFGITLGSDDTFVLEAGLFPANATDFLLVLVLLSFALDRFPLPTGVAVRIAGRLDTGVVVKLLGARAALPFSEGPEMIWDKRRATGLGLSVEAAAYVVLAFGGEATADRRVAALAAVWRRASSLLVRAETGVVDLLLDVDAEDFGARSDGPATSKSPSSSGDLYSF